MRDKTPLLHTIAIIITTGLASSGATILFQRNFISKTEENNLIRELIPSLISNNPRQIDMALLLLESAVEEKKYNIIKKIMDKKVETMVLDAKSILEIIEPIKPTRPITKTEVQPKKSYQEKVIEYADQRKDWRKIINEKQLEIAKPFTREDLLLLLENIDGMTIDKTLKEIVILTAKKINRGDYFSAGIALDWLLRYHNDNRYMVLLGLLKSDIDSNQLKFLKKYFDSNGYANLQRMYGLQIMVKFDLRADTAGEKLDLMNQLFLKDLQGDKPFETRFDPNPKVYKSKFENVR